MVWGRLLIEVLKALSRDSQRKKKLEDDEAYSRETLEALPGVGPTTAERLYEAGFHSPEEIAEASKSDLTDVQGVGKKKARKIINAGLSPGPREYPPAFARQKLRSCPLHIPPGEFEYRSTSKWVHEMECECGAVFKVYLKREEIRLDSDTVGWMTRADYSGKIV